MVADRRGWRSLLRNMKNRLIAWLGVGMTALALPGISQAEVVNGSFESWNLIGWTFHSDVGNRATEPLTRPAGSARTMNSWTPAGAGNPEQTAMNGGRFLAVNTRANANFLGNDTYNTFVSQNFSLNQGEAVSGWANFFNGDNAPLDSAWVRILDGSGGLVATPWNETSGVSVGPATISPPVSWTMWQWVAPTAGNYTLQLGMTTSDANNSASFGFFDGISLGSPQAVPEPSAMVLGLLGGFAILLGRNRIR